MKTQHEPAGHELALHNRGELAERSEQLQALNVAAILEAAVKGAVSADNVAVVKELVALQERMEVREGEKAFARAFNALQADLPGVHARKPVPDRDGNIKYHFAPYEDIMAQVRPILLKHGFAVSFSMTANGGYVTQTCKLTHVAGHAQSNSSSVRIGKGPPGCSETQADGSASTYAKRFALCDALNIVIEKDNDGNHTDAKVMGAPIDPDRITFLREQIAELGGAPCESMVLKLAGVEKVEQIGDAQYAVIVRALEMRRAKKQ